MASSRLFFYFNLLLAGLLIGGCDNKSEYTTVASPLPLSKTAETPCPTTGLITEKSDGQDAIGGNLKGDFLEVADTSAFFIPAFVVGNALFETSFTAAQGGGANVGGHERYTRVPRADRSCPGEWATHTPKRATGPNAQSCLDCHNRPNDGSGSIAGNAQRDPLHSGDIRQIIQRNTPHLFGGGALQLLGEEMTAELQRIRQEADDIACQNKTAVERPLIAKTVDFGVIRVNCQSGVRYLDNSGIKGVSPDLVVRPFQWKKTVKTVRDFVLDAAHNEIGMQGVEVAGAKQDGDGDGVINELSVGQVTALTVYMAAQPRPTTRTELTDWKVLDEKSADILHVEPVKSEDERQKIKRGADVFAQIGCAECHKPQLTLNHTKFTEPNGAFGAVSFDLAQDIPDNTEVLDGKKLGDFNETDGSGHTLVHLYGDLKRHDLGPELAEAIDEPSADAPNGIGRSSFGTKELWGVGCTGPWLHDGRATTLTEAIRFHGGEAANSRAAFKALDQSGKQALFAFLYNQVLYLHEFNENEANDRAVCGKATDEPANL